MKNHNNKANSFKSLAGSSIIPKSLNSQKLNSNHSVSHKAKIYQTKSNVNSVNNINAKNMSTVDYFTDNSIKKAEPSSYRSKQGDRDIQQYRKNIDYTTEKDTSTALVLKKSINKEIRFNSLKKIMRSQNTNDSKYIRASSIISNIEGNNNSQYEYNSNEINKNNDMHTNHCLELELENSTLKSTIKILVNYITVLNKQIDNCVNKQLKCKMDEIHQLKV